MIEIVKKIIGRGKYRDVYGNPYIAAIAITNRRVIVWPMTYWNSGESGVVSFVGQYIKKISSHIRFHRESIEVCYKHVWTDSCLEHPEYWRVEWPDLPVYFAHNLKVPIREHGKINKNYKE